MNTNKILKLFLGLIFLPGFIYAQSNIKAKVLDGDGVMVPIANMLIVDIDGNMLKGGVIYDGVLEMQWAFKAEHFLKITALGWSDKIIPLDECSSDCNFGKITLEQSSFDLAEVVVTEKIKPFEAKNGIINVNVENTILSEKESIVDILRSSPGVFIRGENNVNVFGKGQAKVYIDGVEIQSNDILQSLSPSEIKKVEIVSNPSAKYGAEGKAVINVITRSNKLKGVLGQVRTNLTKRSYQSAYYAANLSVNNGKYSFYFSGSWNPYKIKYDEEYQREILTPEGLNKLNNDITTPKVSWLNNTYRTKLGYRIDDKQNIAFEVKGKVFNETNTRTNINDITQANEPEFRLTSNTDGEKKYYYNTLAAYYQLNVSDKQKLFITTNYTSLQQKQLSLVAEQSNGNDPSNSKSDGENIFNIFSAQADYEQKLSEDLILETGLKFSDTNTDGDNQLSIMEDGKYVPLPNFSTDFNYQEQNYAAYTTLKKQFGKLSTNIGLRYEYTVAEGTKTEAGKFIDRDFSNLFPSASLTYNISDLLTSNLTYSRRIGKPSFSDLDPTVEYIDAYSIMRGNPELNPEFTDSYEFNFSYSGNPFIKLGYNSSKDPISLVIEKGGENELVNVGIIRNLDYSREYNVGFTIPVITKWWTCVNGVNYTRAVVKFNDTFNNGDARTGNNWNIFTFQDFNVGKGINFGTQYYWYSKGLNGVFDYHSGQNLSAWVGKKINNGKWLIRLHAEDILKSNFEGATMNVNDVKLTSRTYYDHRRIRLSATYKFGKLKKSTAGKSKANEELNRIKLK